MKHLSKQLPAILAALILITSSLLPAYAEKVPFSNTDFTFYGNGANKFTIADESLYDNGTGNKLAVYNGAVTANFSASVGINTKNNTAWDGIYFYGKDADTVNTGSIDSLTGYYVHLRRDGIDSYDIRVYKYAEGNWRWAMFPEGGTDFDDRVYISQATTGITEDQTITLAIEVQNNILKVKAYQTADPSMVSRIITYNLANKSNWENDGNFSPITQEGFVGLLSVEGREGSRYSNFSVTNNPSGIQSMFYNGYVKNAGNDINLVSGKFYSDGIDAKRVMFAEAAPNNVKMTADITLDENGKTFTGFIFRAGNYKTDGYDSFEGYNCVVEKAGDGNRIDIKVFKNGSKLTNDDYTWLGIVGELADEGDDGFIAKLADGGKNQTITMFLEVEDNTAKAYLQSTANPAVKTDTLTVDLTRPGSAGDTKGDYFSGGKTGIAMAFYKSAVENVSVTEYIAPFVPQVAGPLNDLNSYTLYSSTENTFTQSSEAFTASGAGMKKALVNHLKADDFSASMTVKLDENGNISTGFIFREQYIGNGQDDLEGYICGVERIYNADNPGRLDFVIYKFGKKAGESAYSWLGEVARFVDEGDGALLNGLGKANGAEIVFHVDLIEDRIHAFAAMKNDSSRISSTMNTGIKKPAPFDTALKYYTEGGFGIYAGGIGETDITNVLSNVKVDTLKPVTEGTFNKDSDFYMYTHSGKNLTNINGKFTSDALGTKRAMLKHGYFSNHKASVELYNDAAGNLQGGLLVHASNITQWGTALKGYGVIVENYSQSPGRIDIAVFKYGALEDNSINWLGYMQAEELEGDRYVSEGEESLSDGAAKGYLLSVTVEGNKMKVLLKNRATGAVSKTLTYNLDVKALGTLDTKKEIFTVGETGVMLEKGAFANLSVSSKNPNTGDNNYVIYYAVIMAASLAAGVWVWLPEKAKKKV